MPWMLNALRCHMLKMVAMTEVEVKVTSLAASCGVLTPAHTGQEEVPRSLVVNLHRYVSLTANRCD